jgi:negative regulator of replication initiation
VIEELDSPNGKTRHIVISQELYQWLTEQAVRKAETYEQILRRLLEEAGHRIPPKELTKEGS